MLRDLSRSVVIVAGCVVDPEAPIFSPARDREERFRSARASRKSKVPPSQQNRRKKAPTRLPSDRYHPTSSGMIIAVVSAEPTLTLGV